MKYKLNLSKDGEQLLKKIGNQLGLTPNIICRYAVILSLKDDSELNFDFDSKGIEFQRYTLTGEFDLLFRELIKSKEQRNLSDDEYFGSYLKAHIERGLCLLTANVQLHRSFENMVFELINSGGTI